jgi:hypothetical protein
MESVPNDLCKTTEPHNDYFRTQFLLSFPVTGIHQTVIEVGATSVFSLAYDFVCF